MRPSSRWQLKLWNLGFQRDRESTLQGFFVDKNGDFIAILSSLRMLSLLSYDYMTSRLAEFLSSPSSIEVTARCSLDQRAASITICHQVWLLSKYSSPPLPRILVFGNCSHPLTRTWTHLFINSLSILAPLEYSNIYYRLKVFTNFFVREVYFRRKRMKFAQVQG